MKAPSVAGARPPAVPGGGEPVAAHLAEGGQWRGAVPPGEGLAVGGGSEPGPRRRGPPGRAVHIAVGGAVPVGLCRERPGPRSTVGIGRLATSGPASTTDHVGRHIRRPRKRTARPASSVRSVPHRPGIVAYAMDEASPDVPREPCAQLRATAPGLQVRDDEAGGVDVSPSREVDRTRQNARAGLGLVLGAGFGTVVSLLVAGAVGIALGAAVGAAVGLLLGAVTGLRATHTASGCDGTAPGRGRSTGGG